MIAVFDRLLRRLRRPAGGRNLLQVGELRRRQDSGQVQLIIDVRGKDEFDGPLGHIPGAINVPLAALAERTAELAQTALPIVLVCLTDKRSSQAAEALEAAGVRDVAVLQGGMRAWRGK